ncbi:hypothetical protein MFLO_07077 [Listeria floridensis FSL S10-1187]|uniref:Modifier protein of major autolysin LytC n=1 Tax=Listeria floridensis FSL S10-1187 TaxID=1265817 RepID=A0ABN0RFP4_9LIST|nr:immunoglobulin-like domain-containing protein [Listeria floridensis]EUJ32290.1 hypothetical protein MFLO_07077 [Listeria floridensis FSL S10-1187]
MIQTELSAPTINELTDSSTTVSGTAEPNANLEIRIPHPSGGVMTWDGKADSNGNYSVAIPKQAAGTVVQVIASLNGLKSPAASQTVVDKTAPNTPVLFPIDDQATKAEGTTEAFAKVEISSNGMKIAEGMAGSDGKFSIAIPVQKEGNQIRAIATDASGNTSSPALVTVTGTAIQTPTINPVTEDSTSVTGTAAPNADVKLSVPQPGGGVLNYDGKADANGIYSINIAKQTAGTVLEVVTTLGSKTSAKATTTVQAGATDYYLTAPASYTIGEPTISGMFGKDISKVRLWVNGKVVAQATTDVHGNYTFSNVNKFVTKNSDVVNVVGVDNAYVERNRKTVTVVGNDIVDYSLTVNQNPYVIGTSTALTGTYGQGISKVRLFVNGSVVAQATTSSNGTYTFTNAAQFITSSADTVKVVGVDAQYIQRAEKAVTVQGSAVTYTLTADPYALNQTSLTGKYSSNIARVRLFVNGVVVTQAQTDGNGNYTFPNAGALIKAGDRVEVVGVDSRFVEQKRIQVTVLSSNMNYTLTVATNPYTVGSSTMISGTYGKDIARVRLFVNGAVVTQAQTDGNGNYTIPNAANFIKSSSDVVKVVGVDSSFVQRAESGVTLR